METREILQQLAIKTASLLSNGVTEPRVDDRVDFLFLVRSTGVDLDLYIAATTKNGLVEITAELPAETHKYQFYSFDMTPKGTQERVNYIATSLAHMFQVIRDTRYKIWLKTQSWAQ